MGDRNYFAEYVVMWLKVILVYLVGGFILGMLDGGAFSQYFGRILALTVFGTTFFNKVVPFNLFGNHDVVIFFWILKIIISLVIGILAFPIVNLFYIINIIIKVVKFFMDKR